MDRSLRAARADDDASGHLGAVRVFGHPAVGDARVAMGIALIAFAVVLAIAGPRGAVVGGRPVRLAH